MSKYDYCTESCGKDKEIARLRAEVERLDKQNENLFDTVLAAMCAMTGLPTITMRNSAEWELSELQAEVEKHGEKLSEGIRKLEADAKLGRLVRSEKIWNVERREKTLAWGDPDPNTGRRLPAASAVYYSVGACNRPGVVDWFDGATPEEALEKAGITEGDGE